MSLRTSTLVPVMVLAAALAACAPSGSAGRGGAVPDAAGDAAPGSVPQRTEPLPVIAGQRQWTGSQSAAFTDMFVMARDQRGWELLWQLAGNNPPGPLPDGAMGAGVFLGMRPTAGYGVEVVDMLYWPHEVVVVYDETAPPPDAAAAQVVTAPYAIAVAPASEAPVHFRRADMAQ